MSEMMTPLMTLPPRELSKSPEWRIDDTVIDGSRRWIIRLLNPTTGKVELEAANTTNAGMWWKTTIDKLPAKAGAR